MLTALISTLGALAGVGLGTWFGAHLQRKIVLEARDSELRQSQRQACMDFLAAYRRYRHFVLVEAERVDLIRRPDDDGGVRFTRRM
jgi:hypothetical protein